MSSRSVGFILARSAGITLVAVGALGCAFPVALSRGFGLPTDEAHALGFVRAAAVRDSLLGVALVRSAIRGRRKELRAQAYGAASLAAADFINAYASGGRRLRPEHALHVGGSALFAAIALLLR